MFRFATIPFFFLSVVVMLIYVVNEFVRFLDHINGTGGYVHKETIEKTEE